MNPQQLVLFVLSCDAYQDLWEDFFNLRDRYWPDCPYEWYLVTEEADFKHENVTVIKCGKDLNWSGRLRFAINKIDSPYYGIFLEDYFITDKIDNAIIENLLKIMKDNAVTFINTSDVFYNCIGRKELDYYKENLIIIPNHKVYGISTESGIWSKQYLLEKLGDGDYSAWQFEIDRVNEAKSENGLGGFNLCDDRMPFHVSILPVVIQGKVYPAARKFFQRNGYEFMTNRDNMTFKQVLLFDMKMKFSNMKHGKKVLKWLASKILGIKFFT